MARTMAPDLWTEMLAGILPVAARQVPLAVLLQRTVERGLAAGALT